MCWSDCNRHQQLVTQQLLQWDFSAQPYVPLLHIISVGTYNQRMLHNQRALSCLSHLRLLQLQLQASKLFQICCLTQQLTGLLVQLAFLPGLVSGQTGDAALLWSVGCS